MDFFWKLHKDHRQPEKEWFEKNDTFFIFYALVSILLFWSWSAGVFNYRLAIGSGILFYGMAYFTVHDIFIHQRFKWFKRTDNLYLGLLEKCIKYTKNT